MSQTVSPWILPPLRTRSALTYLFVFSIFASLLINSNFLAILAGTR